MAICSLYIVGCEEQQPNSSTTNRTQVETTSTPLSTTTTLNATPSPSGSVKTPTSPSTSPTISPVPNTTGNSKLNQFPNLPRLLGKATVVMKVNGSPITIELDGDKAPISVGNFVDLVKRGFYNGVSFHRVVRQPEPFVVQGGDPNSKNPNYKGQLGTSGFEDPATGKPRYIPLEIQPQGAKSPVYSQILTEAGIAVPPELQHKRGAVAMARSAFPDSASSQFYFALADLSFLDGNYAVFGYVTSGMDVVDKIKQGDRIESAEVTKGLENLKSGQ
ncbi:peptidylprolyl isomerase [Merismopedia glauca CCAP 1448/3]|uniref:Peptidyl-prolyl cis-trans isomerase n=2 Tax=Merismopedia TaxID=53402 RepID=A0A2T1C2S4_9CYAN|nr:peptidylprolyl isomerase [Merismopedia glauca CCAP 1448/3]